MNNQNYQILLGIILIAVYFIYFRGSEGMTRFKRRRLRARARVRARRRARRARRQGVRKNPRSASKAMQKLRRCRKSLRAAKMQTQSGSGDAW